MQSMQAVFSNNPGNPDMEPRPSPSDEPSSQAQSRPKQPTRKIPSSDLFVEAQEVHIEHAGETYRLRKTRAGKLILTK
ncbi:MAG: hemin uptake protein HemP [Planctomycetaceae bacterium]